MACGRRRAGLGTDFSRPRHGIDHRLAWNYLDLADFTGSAWREV